jgi:hypothetical protein
MSANKERGAVLIVAMIILAVLTILGMAAMDSSTLQIKMASNLERGAGIGRDFQAAEDGLAVALASFKADVTGFQTDLDDGVPYPNGTALTGAAWDIRPWSFDSFKWEYLVTGTQNGATHRTFLRRINVPFNIDGALSCYDGCSIDMYGNVEVDGNDHTWPSDFGCNGNGPACKPADNPFGQPPISAIYMESVGTVTEHGSVDKYGASPLIKTGGGGHTSTEWETFVTLLIDFATAHNGSDWGTRDNPAVHHIDVNMMILGNTKSAGVLLITASAVTFSADFYHEGLILVANPAGVTITMQGGFDVCGAIVAAGPNVQLDVGGSGTPTISYCSEALQNASTKAGIKRLSWFQE